MSPSPSRSITSAVLVLARSILILASLGAGCSDDAANCGIQNAPASGMLAQSADVTLEFGTFTAGANNDCPAADAPTGLTSLTIFSQQKDGTGFLTLCVPRPDLLTTPGRSLGADPGDADIRIVDLSGMTPTCTYRIDSAHVPTGTGHAEGLCDAGTNAAGFALVLDGAVGLTRTCGTTVDAISVQLGGRVAVLPIAP